MLPHFRHIYLEKRLFYFLSIITILMIVSYFYTPLFVVSQLLLLSLIIAFLVDILILFNRNGVSAKRTLPDKFSNGDQNKVKIHITNFYSFKISIKLIDEIPFQFQKRDFMIKEKLKSRVEKLINYELRPTERGEYFFVKLNVYISNPIGLISRKFEFDKDKMVPTYPSFIQLRKYDIMAISFRDELDIKKVRRLGHTMEFEQIKDYVMGDDIRTINWKATAKNNHLMVNQFQDEKSQPIYSIIDKGRVMKMPFEGLSLLDYAINATLVISNVSLKKQDKAGMMCFSKKVENHVVADRRTGQMQLILETLYNIKTDFWESDFGILYTNIKRHLTQRSLLFMYTNFETLDGMDRQLSFLQAISKQHVLVLVFFENTEMGKILLKPAENVKEIYHQTVVELFSYEKRLIVKELNKRGIYTILTKPENLTINVINKYLEFKSRGVI